MFTSYIGLNASSQGTALLLAVIFRQHPVVTSAMHGAMGVQGNLGGVGLGLRLAHVPPAQSLLENVAELLAEGAVDDEVGRAVQDLQNTADLHDEERSRRADLRVVLQDQLHQPGRQVAEHEDQNDYDHDQCDVVLPVIGARAHGLAPSLYDPVGHQEFRIEGGQQ